MLIKGFWQLADPKIWVASTIPMLLAAAMAIAAWPEQFSLLWFVFALAAIYLIEIGKNAINEYVDFVTGADPAVDAEHRTPFSGGKKTIVDGLLTPGQALIISVLTFSAAAAIGLMIVFLYNAQVIIFGVAGIVLAVAYSLPPFKLAYRGLGELTVGFVFGPLLMNGMYLLLAGRIDRLPILASLPLGFLIANVLVINQFPDYEADRSAGKRNWVVRLGKKRAVNVYALLFVLTYASIIMTAIVMTSPVWLIGLISAPLAVKSVHHAARHYQDIQKLVFSNAATIKIYILTGLLLIVATILEAVLQN